MSATDPGTNAAIRVQSILDGLGVELPWGECRKAADAAREDVPDLIRQAKADALEEFALHHVLSQSPGRMAEDLHARAAVIREGRAS